MAEFEVVRVAGKDGNRRATTVFIMKSGDGGPGSATTLLGTAAIVPDAGALRHLAGEFAFTAHLPRGTVDPKHITVVDDLGNQVKPRTVTVEPAGIAKTTGSRV